MRKNVKKNPLKHFGIAKDIPKDVLNDFEKAILEAKKVDPLGSSKRFYDIWNNEK